MSVSPAGSMNPTNLEFTPSPQPPSAGGELRHRVMASSASELFGKDAPSFPHPRPVEWNHEAPPFFPDPPPAPYPPQTK